MSLRSASQNAPVSARTRSRLESVLKAGIATNAGDGGSSKRADPARNAARLFDMNQDVLAKILGIAVNDPYPCISLKQLWVAWCGVNKESDALCKSGRLYDEANKRLKWYGSYGTLEKVNASGKYGNYDYQGWFQYSCDMLQNRIKRLQFEQLQRFQNGGLHTVGRSSITYIVYQSIHEELSSQHPAHSTLLHQRLHQIINNQVKTWLRDLDTLLKDIEESNFPLVPQYKILSRWSIQNIEEAMILLEDDVQLRNKFEFMISHVWDWLIEFMYEHKDDALTDLAKNLMDLAYWNTLYAFDAMILYTSLGATYQHINFDLNYDENTAKGVYNYYAKIDKAS